MTCTSPHDVLVRSANPFCQKGGPGERPPAPPAKKRVFSASRIRQARISTVSGGEIGALYSRTRERAPAASHNDTQARRGDSAPPGRCRSKVAASRFRRSPTASISIRSPRYSGNAAHNPFAFFGEGKRFIFVQSFLCTYLPAYRGLIILTTSWREAASAHKGIVSFALLRMPSAVQKCGRRFGWWSAVCDQ